MKCCETTQPLQHRLSLTEVVPPIAPLVPVAIPVAAFAATISAPQWSHAQAHQALLLHVQSAPTYILTGSLLI
ncbi:MAG: hypothetical protein ACRD2X_09180 [Vicinamibacteraceae bacterium]